MTKNCVILIGNLFVSHKGVTAEYPNARLFTVNGAIKFVCLHPGHGFRIVQNYGISNERVIS